MGMFRNSQKLPNKACTGLVGTVRLFEHFQRPKHFSARRVNQHPAHKPVTQAVSHPTPKQYQFYATLALGTSK